MNSASNVLPGLEKYFVLIRPQPQTLLGNYFFEVVLLKLPAASANAQNPIGWMDAFFTATSAVTVTGLAVRTTAIDFSRFGQVIILILLQVGGVGFIAFSVLFADAF